MALSEKFAAIQEAAFTAMSRRNALDPVGTPAERAVNHGLPGLLNAVAGLVLLLNAFEDGAAQVGGAKTPQELFTKRVQRLYNHHMVETRPPGLKKWQVLREGLEIVAQGLELKMPDINT